MKKKDKAKKDIEMAFDFARYLIDHPGEITKIPDNGEVSFHDISNGSISSNPKKYQNPKSVQVNVKRDFEIKKKVA